VRTTEPLLSRSVTETAEGEIQHGAAVAWNHNANGVATR
jgi:hypothetical protein